MKGGQGQSVATLDKERRIAACLSVTMKIADARFGARGFSYWHLDANSGSGWNETVNVPGSPLVFWQMARHRLLGLRPAPFFCDHDPAKMKTLHDRFSATADLPGSYLVPGDNEEAIEVFAECIRQAERPRYAVGSLLIDPNGYFYRNKDGEGAPVNAVRWFCREFPRIDLILNLNMRTYEMQRAVGHDVLPPRDLLASLGKQQWLVGKANAGQSRFLLAIGRNMSTDDHRAIGLYDSESQSGRNILDGNADCEQTNLDLAS